MVFGHYSFFDGVKKFGSSRPGMDIFLQPRQGRPDDSPARQCREMVVKIIFLVT